MKVIDTEQYLHAVSAGSITGYDVSTNVSAVVGCLSGAFIGFAVAHRSPNVCSIVGTAVVGGFIGAVAGKTVGAVGYTLVSNIGTILSAPFQIVNFIFKPNS